MAYALLAVGLAPALGSAQPLGTADIQILGLAVDVDTRPDLDGLQTTMTAVKAFPAAVQTVVGPPGATVLPALPAGSLVKARITGPSYPDGPVTLSAPPNQLMEITPLRVAGEHVLYDVRLEGPGGEVLLERDPTRGQVLIDVIEELLVTQVRSRPLTLEEIQEKGIILDDDAFTALQFTVGLTLGSEQVEIELPLVLPSTTQGFTQVKPPQFSRLPEVQKQFEKINIPNFSISGFQLIAPPEIEELGLDLPAINGVVVIPGSIAFLKQFFSVVLQATNVAPIGSGLSLELANATIELPLGGDEQAGSGDDPLSLAITEPVQTPTQPLVDPEGSDTIVSQGTNQAEFLVRGDREGAHQVNFDIRGELFIQSLGETVELMGVAAGVVQVKNPTFSMTLAHPDVVREGEEYSIFATVTNTSSVTANLFSLRLNARSLNGTRLKDGETGLRTLEQLLPGEAESFEFRMVARATGEVTGTIFLADQGINGSFLLTTGVGDTGIPLSPDTLVLPRTVDYLPDDPGVVFAAVRLLGQAYSVATAPAGALPPQISRVSRSYVFDRAVKLAQAGLHARFGEDPLATGQDIAMDYLGTDVGRLADVVGLDMEEQARFVKNASAFDGLRRAAAAGANFSRVMGSLLGQGLDAATLMDLQRDWAERFASRGPHVSFGVSSGGPSVLQRLTDAEGSALGRVDPGEEEAREIPFAAHLPLRSDAELNAALLLVAAPESPTYRLELSAPQGSPSLDVSLVLPDGDGMVQVTYPDLSVEAGAIGRIAWSAAGANAYQIELDSDGDGSVDQTVAPLSVAAVEDPAPEVLAVFQWGKGNRPPLTPTFEVGDPIGRMAGVLFSEEVTPASGGATSSYALEGNRVTSVSLQPDRRLSFVVVEKPTGPFVPEELRVQGVADLRGHPMEAAVSVPIGEDPDRGTGGTVRGQVLTADGRPVPFATVKYIQPFSRKSLFDVCFANLAVMDFVVAEYETDAEGRFALDFVLQADFPTGCPSTPDIWLNERNSRGTSNFKLEAADPETSDIGRASTRIAFDGQELFANVIIRGFGAIEGRVYQEDGTPVVGANPNEPGALFVFATNVSTGEQYQSWVDADGFYAFPRSFLGADGSELEAGKPAVGNVILQILRVSDGFTGVTTVNIPGGGALVTQDILLIPPNRFGTVSGRVFEADGMTGAANVVVQIAGRVLSNVDVFSRSFSQGVVGSTVSDADGFFLFEMVPSGDIELFATRQATFEQTGARAFLSEQEIVDVALILPGSGGTVRGIVIDALGNPVPGAKVAGGPTLANAKADGTFEISGLPVGSFGITAQANDSLATGRTSVRIRAASEVQEGVVIRLQPVATLTGTVFEADGITPVPGQRVQLWIEPNEGILAETVTDVDGVYLFRNFPVGPDLSVRAVREDLGDGGMAFTTLTTPGEVRDLDILFRGLGHIRGRVEQANGTPTRADVVIVRKVWRIIPDDAGRPQNVYLDFVDALAQDEIVGESVRNAISSSGIGDAPQTFFLLRDEPVLIQSDVTTGEFLYDGRATAGPVRAVAFNGFQLPGEATAELPRSLDQQNPAVADVGLITLESAVGRVEGTVTLPDGETPVGAGVPVKIRAFGTFTSISVAGTTLPLPQLPDLDPVTTDENGRFIFPIVPRGGFTVSVDSGVPDPAIRADTPEEMETERFQDELGDRALNVRLFGSAKGVVPAGETVDTSVRMRDVAGVQVTVVQNDGVTPVPQAVVTLTTADGLDRDIEPDFRGLTADANGVIELFPVIEGGFSARAGDPGSSAMGQLSGEIPVNPPNGLEVPVTVTLGTVTTSTGQVVQAPVFGRVIGTVFRADGTQLENPAEVTVNVLGVRLLATYDPATELYEVDDVPAGFHQVEAFEPFTARRGSNTGSLIQQGQEVRADVTLVGLGTVTGQVFDNGGASPVVGADVVLLPSGSFTDKIVTRSDSGGLYSLPGVPLGLYLVKATDPIRGLSGEADYFMRADGDTSTTDVFLEASAQITGTVYGPGVFLDANGLPVDAVGAPLLDPSVASNAFVSLRRDGFEQTVQTDALGRFASGENLLLGSYTLTAVAFEGGDGGTGEATLAENGEVLDVGLALRGTGTVKGEILDSIGVDPIDKARVTLRSSSPFAGPALTKFSDADGSFRFDDIPLGDFSVSVETTLEVPPLGGAAADSSEAHEEVIAFFDDDEDTANGAIRLQNAGTVRGRVVFGDGEPAGGTIVILEGAGLRLSRSAGEMVGDVAVPPGEFRFDGIPLGSYQVAIREPLSNGVAQRSVVLETNGQDENLGDVAVDPDPPTVLSTDPTVGQVDVKPSSAVSVTFNEEIDPGSIDATSFRVAVGGSPLAGSFSFAPDGRTVSFEPFAPMPDRRLVQVEVLHDVLGFEGQVLDPGIQDLAGLSLVSDLRFDFTTSDSTPPAIVSLSPARDAAEVSTSAVVRLELDEPVDRDSVTDFSLVRSSDGTAATGSLNDAPILGGRVLVFVPDPPLQANVEYVATLSGPITDTVGNAIAEDQITWRFETIDTQAPQIDTLSLAAGSVLHQGSVVQATAALAADSGDTVAVEFYVDGALAATRSAVPYRYALSLDPAFGMNVVLAAVAVDEVGNRSTPVELPLIISLNAPPSLSITAPTAGDVSQGSAVNVSVSAADDVGVVSVSFTANDGALGGGTETVAPYQFSFTVPSDAEAGATIRLKASATDGLGATTVSAPVLVTVVDELDPFVTIGSPANGRILTPGTESVEVLVTARDGSGIREIRLVATGIASFDETRPIDPAVSPAAARFVVALPADPPAAAGLTLTASAEDGVGRSGSDEIAVRLTDDVAPTVTSELLEPADGTAEPGDRVRVRAGASDNVGVRSIVLRATGISSQTRTIAPSPATTQVFSFSVPADAVAGEEIRVGVEARDEDGNNSAVEALVVTIVDETAPTVAIVAPAAGVKFAPGSSIDVEVSASDVQGVASISCVGTGAGETDPVVIAIDPPASDVIQFCTYTVPADAEQGVAIQVKAMVDDAAGNISTPAAVRTFFVADTAAPEIVSIEPADAAMDVVIDAVVVVRFDEAVDGGSFASAFSLTGPSGAVAGSIASSGGRTVFIFTPQGEFVTDATYRVDVSTAVEDLEGNALTEAATSSFNVTSDLVGPCLDTGSLVPADGATARALALEVRARFDEALDPAMVTTANVALVRAGDDTPVAVGISLEDADQTVVLTLDERLELATTYRVDWSSEIRDPAANGLRGPVACAGGAEPLAPPPVAVSHSFATGNIRITSPVSGARVIEGQELDLAANASAALGVVELDWSGDLGALGNGNPPAFAFTVTVPTLADLGGAIFRIGAAADLGGGAPVAVDPVAVTVLSANQDADGDGLTNGEEIAQGSDPFASDRPAVMNVAPADGAGGVDIATTVLVSFSRALDPASVSAASVFLEAGGAAVAATYELSADGRSVTLTPDAPLALAQTYDMTVTTGVRSTTGAALDEAFAGSFATAEFGIVSPGDGSSVPERSKLPIEAVAGPALGVVDVVFFVGGEEIDTVASTPYVTRYSVPAASEVATLAILAIARDGGGAEIARDEVTVDVGVRLAFVPKLVGLPVGGEGTLLLTLSAPRSSDVTLDLASLNPAVATAPASALLSAGEVVVEIPVSAANACPDATPTCATSIVASTPTGATGAVVSVSEPDVGACEAGVARADSECRVIARPAGAAALRGRVVARIALPLDGMMSLDAPVLAEAAGTFTPVVVESPDVNLLSGVATNVSAGDTDTTLSVQAGPDAASGDVALLRLRAADELSLVEVHLGQPAAGVFSAVGSPTGVAIRRSRLAARLALAPAGTARLEVGVLTAAADVATPVTVTSTDLALVSAPDTEVVAGKTTATLVLQAGADTGTTVVHLEGGGEVVAVEVAVGQAPSGAAAIAIPAGAAVLPAGNAGTLYLPAGTSRTVTAPLRTMQKAALFGAVSVDAESRDPAVAAVAPSSVELAAVETEAELTVTAGGGDGETVIEFRVGAERLRTLRVIVGQPPLGEEPFSLAPQAGVCVSPGADCP